MKHALILTIALAGCVPAAVETIVTRGEANGPTVHIGTKPPLPKPPLPPGVTRNPDGSVTIREPRCPNCSPWGF